MSIVEKMARAMFENTPVYKDSTRERRWEWEDFPCDDIDPRRYLLGQARAALTATGLTEAQLERLANGTMVCVPVEPTEAMRIAGSQMMVNVYSGGEYGYGRVAAHDGAPGDVGTIYRAMLAAKEG